MAHTMNLDFPTTSTLIRNNAALKLLRSDHAPLIISFLSRMFIIPGANDIPESVLVEALDDELHVLEGRRNHTLYPRTAREYLIEWAAPDKGWLRRFYKAGSNEQVFDITPAVAKTVFWLESLTTRSFVGTESRLLTLVNLLQQMKEGTEQDPAKQLAEVDRRIAELQSQREQVLEGQFRTLDATALKDRLQQFNFMHRDLMSDIREVQQNFYQLDRDLRQEITLWEGGKGELLDRVMGQRNVIDSSDQGRSFKAMMGVFSDTRKQDDLLALLSHVQQIPELQGEIGDARLTDMLQDWSNAAYQTQRIVAQLSTQLRRFLEDRAFLENRRIMETLIAIERNAIEVREYPPRTLGMEIDHWRASITLPMDRRMFTPRSVDAFADTSVTDAPTTLSDVDTQILFANKSVDVEELRRRVRRRLQTDDITTLAEIIREYPLEHGLAEVVAYLQLTDDTFSVILDQDAHETLQWSADTIAGNPVTRAATMPRAIYTRSAS